MLWQWMLTQAHGVHIHPLLHVGLGLVVWIIYLIDRLSDAHRLPAEARDERQSLLFRHRGLVIGLLLPCCIAAAAWIALWHIPQAILVQAASLSILIAIYFLVHVWRLIPVILPKPHTAALLFALGCTTSVRFYAMPETLAAPILECAIFTLLALANLGSIITQREPADGPWTRSMPFMLFGNLLVTSMLLFKVEQGQQASTLRLPTLIIMVSLVLLSLLFRYRSRLSFTSHRALADLALIVPLPLVLL
jgi:hypothetical protein